MKLVINLICMLSVRFVAQDNRLIQAARVIVRKSSKITHSGKMYDKLVSLTSMALRHIEREFTKVADNLPSQIVTGLPRES